MDNRLGASSARSTHIPSLSHFQAPPLFLPLGPRLQAYPCNPGPCPSMGGFRGMPLTADRCKPGNSTCDCSSDLSNHFLNQQSSFEPSSSTKTSRISKISRFPCLDHGTFSPSYALMTAPDANCKEVEVRGALSLLPQTQAGYGDFIPPAKAPYHPKLAISISMTVVESQNIPVQIVKTTATSSEHRIPSLGPYLERSYIRLLQDTFRTQSSRAPGTL